MNYSKFMIKSSKMKVVPNPAVGGKLQLLNVDAENALLRVFDATGSALYNSILKDNFTDLHHLNPGFYFLTLSSENIMHNCSIIIK